MDLSRLTTILYVPSEMAGEHSLEERVNNGFGHWCQIQEPVTQEVMEECMKQWKPEECLLVTAKDATLALAKKWNVATVGYCNPTFPGQSLSGADLLAEGFEEIDEDYLNRIWQRHHGIPWTIFTTERCEVREICLEDIPALFDLYAQPGMTEYMEELYPMEEEIEYERAYIANMYRFYGYGMWLVFDKETGELIGRAGLEHRPYPNENQDATQKEGEDQSENLEDWMMEQGKSWDSEPTEQEHLELEMGYAISSKRWHQGYATEVCEGIIAYAKENLEYSRINCLIQRDNKYSIALVEKLGFTFYEVSEVTGEQMLRYVLSI